MDNLDNSNDYVLWELQDILTLVPGSPVGDNNELDALPRATCVQARHALTEQHVEQYWSCMIVPKHLPQLIEKTLGALLNAAFPSTSHFDMVVCD